jgi:hypothetical protein
MPGCFEKTKICYFIESRNKCRGEVDKGRSGEGMAETVRVFSVLGSLWQIPADICLGEKLFRGEVV